MPKFTVMVECTTGAELAAVMAALAEIAGTAPIGVGAQVRETVQVSQAAQPGTTATASTAGAAGKYSQHPNLRKLVAALMAEDKKLNLAGLLDRCRELRAAGGTALDSIAEDDLDDRVENAFMALAEKG